MAKVVAPLLSLDATGTHAGALVFAHYPGRQTVRRKRVARVPNDPKTPTQIFNRDFFASMVAIWQNFSTDEKNTLDTLGNSVSYSGFNHHIKRYRERRPTDCGNVRCGFSELGDLTY